MAEKKDILLDHDYDGIQEFDNDLPPWWLWLFYISIAFAIVYMIYYEFTGLGPSQVEEYMMDVNPQLMQIAEAGEKGGLIYHSPYYSPKGEVTPRVMVQFSEYIGPDIDFAALAMEAIRRFDDKGMQKLKAMFEVHVGAQVSADNLIMEAMRRADDQQRAKLQASFPELWNSFNASGGTIMQTPVTAEAQLAAPVADSEPKIEALTTDSDLAAGKDIYDKNCLSCHMIGGAGGIGPNFTDDYWIHGAGMNNMIRTINTGIPSKGMITWRGILSEQQIQQVSSYILTMHGTNPANPKAPQGEKVEYPLN